MEGVGALDEFVVVVAAVFDGVVAGAAEAISGWLLCSMEEGCALCATSRVALEVVVVVVLFCWLSSGMAGGKLGFSRRDLRPAVLSGVEAAEDAGMRDVPRWGLFR